MRREKELRGQPRFRYVEGVRVMLPGAASGVEGMVADLSLTGCSVRFELAMGLEVGSTVEVSFRSSYMAFRAMGTVRRLAQKGLVVGIAFSQMSMRGRGDLIDLVEDLEQRQVRLGETLEAHRG